VKHERARVRARLADVADAARTSKPIASRILNDDPSLTVSEDLRRRVLEAARELGYRPHAAARSLRRAATGALGLLVPALGNPVYTQLMRGAFRRAGELGFTVVLAEDFEEQEAGELFARLVLEGRIDGLMIASIRVGHPLLPLLEERPVPHVFVNRGVSRSSRNVLMDDAHAVELAVGHLVSLGHRSIVHLAGPRGLDPVERRAAAFRSRAAEAGLERAEVVHGGFLEQDGVDGARLALERWPGVTAIFTATVSQALGVLNVAWERDLRVPQDVSVVAHADNQLADYTVPPLTAVRMPLGELGAEAVAALVVQIETGAARDVLVAAAPELVLRASTAGPRPD
jgi:DNA-binding LacI/PurR family transcriptional regulator